MALRYSTSRLKIVQIGFLYSLAHFSYMSKVNAQLKPFPRLNTPSKVIFYFPVDFKLFMLNNKFAILMNLIEYVVLSIK